MIRYEHYIDAQCGYAELFKLLEENKTIPPQPNTPSALRGVVAGAAIEHFSTLAEQKQFEIVAEYVERMRLG